MYEEHFGLNRPPFKITPDTSLFFGGGKSGDILSALLYAVHRGEGIVKVVGEVGSGKTMLCRMLQHELPESVKIIYIVNPSVSPEDVPFVIAHELELAVAKQASRHEVMHMLQNYLVQRHMENKQVVLFIEEAQGMPLKTLEEIRLLSNLETDQNKLLQIILFGQPELDENLALKSMRQLRERITHSFQLLPLSHEEVHQYLNFRLREVGYTGPELINQATAKKIQRYSGGLLRRINIIADKMLLAAFAESTHNLTVKHVMAAVNDSSFAPAQKNNGKWLAIALTIIVALALGLYQFQAWWLELVIGQPALQVKNSIGIAEPDTIIAPHAGQPIKLHETRAPETAITPEISATANQAGAVELAVEDNNVIPGNNASNNAVNLASLAKAVEVIEIKQERKPAQINPNLTEDDNQWLNTKLEQSQQWLANAGKDKVSIQVMMRNKTAAKELVWFLKNKWPLDLHSTYLYEETGTIPGSVYRVFYGEFDSIAEAQQEILQLPEYVRVNDPYLHSIERMQEAWLN